MKPARITLAAAGLALMLYALAGAAAVEGPRLATHAAFLLAVLFGHDLILLPIAIVVGAVAGRLVPPWAKGPVHGALFASATLSMLALPFLLGYGRSATNPSALPLHYGRGLLITLAVVWSLAGAAAAYHRWQQRPTHARRRS